MVEFTNDNGEVLYERMQEIIQDTTDGYLSNQQDIEYVGGGSGVLSRLKQEDNVDRDEVGSRLLSSLSDMHSILMDLTIKGKDEDYVLERLAKKTGEVSRLSDAYSGHDSMYARNYHDDIVRICQVIQDEAP